MDTETLDYKRGEADGRKDGGARVRPLSDTILKRHYSRSYADGYKIGYDKATEPHRLRAEGKV